MLRRASFNHMSQAVTQIGKYRIERELGRGGMGVVYKAFDPVVERTVAIKTIRLDVDKPEELVARLKREARSVGQLEHPNIVMLYDAGEAEGLFYLAMQFIQGQTLQDRIDRQRWFPLKEVVELFQQICAGLDYAHRHGVIHRDIKPANIMIAADGAVKLTDFGIAKHTQTSTSSSGLVLGTPSYMSPEQALGRMVDGRSDIFSLGSILYELTSGEKAFPGQNVTTVIYKIVHETPTPISALQPGLDPALESIVLKALAKSPEQRFQTCAELAAALQLYFSHAGRSVARTQVFTAPAPVAAPPPAVPAVAPHAATTPLPTPLPALAAPPRFTQPLPAPSGTPLIWLVAGVLGTLLLVVVILVALQLRRPAPGPTPASATAPVNPPAASTTATSTPPAGPATGEPAKESATPPDVTTSPAESAASQPETESPPPPVVKKAAKIAKPSGAGPRRSGAGQAGASAAPVATKRVETKAVAETAGTTPSPAAPKPAAPAQASPAAASSLPETFDSLIVKGDLAFQQSRYQDALDAYSKAYRLNPTSPRARRKIATTLIVLGRIDEARRYQ